MSKWAEDLIELDADEPPDSTPVFRGVDTDITLEHAIPSDPMDVGISITIQALEEELAARWYGEIAAADLVAAVRKRVTG